MKIEKVEKVVETWYYVETDEKEYPSYRTDGKGNWERAMGESWEQWYHTKELDELLQEKLRLSFIKDKIV